jgi:hypothetical protein
MRHPRQKIRAMILKVFFTILYLLDKVVWKNSNQSNRGDHPGLDSPPFDGERGLWLNPLAFIMKIFEPPDRVELKAM